MLVGGTWADQGKCRGNPRAYDLSSYPRGTTGPQLQARAQRLCADCPVVVSCQRQVYDCPNTTGVIQGGFAIAGDFFTPDWIRHRLAERLHVRFVPASRAYALLRRREQELGQRWR